VEGVFTHFAAADRQDLSCARRQLERFLALLGRLDAQGLSIPLKHAANSAAAIHLPEAHLDMVRIGISLYGLYPSEETDRSRVSLRPAMTLKTRIVFLKEVPPGTAVSYGCTFTTTGFCLLATLPVGYADGYARALSNRGQVLVREKRATVAGRVCMDQTVIDVGNIPGVSQGDEVVLFGRQGSAVLHVDEIARLLDTINYEVVTSVSRRVPRVYL